LRQTAEERGLAYLPELPAQESARADAGRHRLLELGLEHFEGRSWRGFHHHACLVTLAHSFGAT
jgi:hypothetical protein